MKVGIFIKLTALLFLSGPLWAQNDLKFVVEESVVPKEALASGYLHLFEDTTAQLSIEQIMVNPQLLKTKNHGPTLPSPKLNSNYWSRIIIKNETRHSKHWILSVGSRRSPDLMEAFVLKDGAMQHLRAGAMTPFSQLARKDRYASMIPVDLDSKQQITVLLKIRTTTRRSLNLHARLESSGNALTNRNPWLYFQLLSMGAFAIFFIYNTLVFVVTNDKPYLLYALYLLFWSGFFFNNLGLSSITVFKEEPWNAVNLGVAINGLEFVFYLLFSKSFLDTSKNYPKLNQWINACIWIHIIVPIINSAILHHFHDLNSINTVLATLMVTQISVSAKIVLTVIKSRSTIIYYYCFGLSSLWTLTLLGFVLFVIGYEEGMMLAQVGSMVEIVAFSLALAHRSKQNEIEKRKAKEELIEQLLENQKLQDQYAKELEQKVVERTKEITIQKEEILLKNELLEKGNHEKEVMLAEIHHRVKNNLQVISSMLNMQARRLLDESAVKAVQEGRDRVKAMALVHQKLYQSEHLDVINMRDYLSALIQNILATYGFDNKRFDLDLKIENIKVDFEMAISLGLIINELISNALKYAYHEVKNPHLEVALSLQNHTLELLVADNGMGLPGDFKLENKANFGLKLVHSSVADLDAELQMENTNGTTIKIHVPYKTAP